MVKTECYKCATEIEAEDELSVHLLCSECQEDFDDWFASELRSMGL